MAPPSTERAVAFVRDETAKLLETLSGQELKNFSAALMRRTGRLFFTGQGRSGLIAQMAAMRCMHLGLQAHAVGEVKAPAIRGDDSLVVFSGSGTTPVSLHFARIAQQLGASILVITRETESPLACMADHTLIIPAQGSAQFAGSLFEQGALLAFDALIAAIVAEHFIAFDAMQGRHTNLQ
ncbi:MULTISPECIES: SIS domain-containing protein [Asaia]|uniref:Possible 6-phospho-3-hexuloisomerase n=1 Tax=Asaia bogorensis TaxID=91915 RepID=A0A060QD68_9PROT|nr:MULTISPECIES: SIS domain-containing protein [Asaia]MDL2171488.1 SIS domain-containing protein [Asaia sp. HumB]CDG38633.1 possible 6-phospho-3-hexuloisomerase [Asaia bogorensis]